MSDLAFIEAALFLSGKPVSPKALAEMLGTEDVSLVEQRLGTLVHLYSSRETGLEVVKLGEKYKLQLKKEFADKLRTFGTVATDLSRAELKTLALVVYKQPIKQSTVVKNRGSGAYDHIHKLLELNFLKASKERNTLILAAGSSFKEYFGEDAVSLQRKVKTPLDAPAQSPPTTIQESLAPKPPVNLDESVPKSRVGEVLEEELEELAGEKPSQ